MMYNEQVDSWMIKTTDDSLRFLKKFAEENAKFWQLEIRVSQGKVKNMRGVLTNKIQTKASSFLQRKISQKELRLYPYIDYCIKNACCGWSYSKMDEEEIKILNRLYREGYIIYSPEKVIVTRIFYNFMQDILAMSYVEEFL